MVGPLFLRRHTKSVSERSVPWPKFCINKPFVKATSVPAHRSGPPGGPLRAVRCHVRFGSKADILRCGSDVRFTPNSGHSTQTMKRTLKYVIAAIILALSFAEPAAAGPSEDADAAVKKRDYATAVRLIRPVAEQGNANAQYNLGVFYDNGLGVPQDRVRAYMWLNLAAMQGRESAATIRDLVARLMTPAQISEAQKMSREWKPTK